MAKAKQVFNTDNLNGEKKFVVIAVRKQPGEKSFFSLTLILRIFKVFLIK